MNGSIKPIRSLKFIQLNFVFLTGLVAAVESKANFLTSLRNNKKHRHGTPRPLSLSFSPFPSTVGNFLLVLNSSLFASSSQSNWLSFTVQVSLSWQIVLSRAQAHSLSDCNSQVLSGKISPWFCPKIHMGTVNSSVDSPIHSYPCGAPSPQSPFVKLCWFNPFPQYKDKVPKELLEVTDCRKNFCFK